MTRLRFSAVMMTSWLYMLGQCSSTGVGVNCSHDIISQTVRVNCTVDYSRISEPSDCVTEWGFLQTQNCSTDKGLECSYGKKQNCTIGPGKDTLRVGVNCSHDIVSQTVRVNCTVDYSEISKPSDCVTEWGFLQTQNCSTDKGLECSYGKKQNCPIGPGKNTLSAEVINLQKQQEYRVYIHTSCGDGETSFRITPPLQVSGDAQSRDNYPADQKVTWAILGTCIAVILMIAAVIFLQRKKLPHPIAADDYDTVIAVIAGGK